MGEVEEIFDEMLSRLRPLTIQRIRELVGKARRCINTESPRRLCRGPQSCLPQRFRANAKLKG